MSLRGKVAVELGVIGTLAGVFLILFPRRNPVVDVTLAWLALACILFFRDYTKRVVWAASPLPVREDRLKRCLAVTAWVTVAPGLLLLAIGGAIAYRSGGWPAVAERLFNWRILAAFGCYLPWALVQQTLLQFYLLGRLLALFPRRLWWMSFLVTGICFGLVHLPDAWTAVVTVAAGAVWSLIYYRYRLVLPLALSHAALGSAFYYGIFGHDLAAEWRAILP